MDGTRLAWAASPAAAVALVGSLTLGGLDVTEGSPLNVNAPDFAVVAAVLVVCFVSGLLSSGLSALPLARATGSLGLAAVWTTGAVPALLITPPFLLYVDRLAAPWGAVHLAGGLVGAGLVGLLTGTRTAPDQAWVARPVVAGAAAIATLWVAVTPVEAFENLLPVSSDVWLLVALPVIALLTVAVTVGVCLSGPPHPRGQLAAGLVAGLALILSLPDPLHIAEDALRFRQEALVVCSIPLVSLGLVAGGLRIQQAVRYRRSQQEEA